MSSASASAPMRCQREPTDQYGQSGRQKGGEEKPERRKAPALSAPDLPCGLLSCVLRATATGDVCRMVAWKRRSPDAGAPRSGAGNSRAASSRRLGRLPQAFAAGSSDPAGELYVRGRSLPRSCGFTRRRSFRSEPFRRELYPKLVRLGARMIADGPPDARHEPFARNHLQLMFLFQAANQFRGVPRLRSGRRPRARPYRTPPVPIAPATASRAPRRSRSAPGRAIERDDPSIAAARPNAPILRAELTPACSLPENSAASASGWRGVVP